MSDYEEIMKSLVKFRDYCKKQRSCNYCEFQVTEQHSRWCKKMPARNYRRKNKNVEIEEEE